MKKFVGFIVALDAAVQKGVDATAFFLMRHLGVGKSFVRFMVGTIVGLCLILVATLPESFGVTSRVTFLLSVIGMLRMIISVMTYFTDRKAEAANMASPIDADASFRFAWEKCYYSLLGTVCTVLILAEVHPEQVPLPRFVVVLSIVAAYGWLQMFYTYLARTPFTPPPRRKLVLEREPELALAPARIPRR